MYIMGVCIAKLYREILQLSIKSVNVNNKVAVEKTKEENPLGDGIVLKCNGFENLPIYIC